MPRKTGNGFKSFESKTESGKHYRIAINMVESKAWEDLDIYARALYHELKAKYNKHYDKKKPAQENANNISFTYKEGQQLMSKNKFTQARDSLIKNGFIKMVEYGRYAMNCNIYGLSELWQQYPDISIALRSKRSTSYNKSKRQNKNRRSNMTHVMG